jgi:hypothetical protein
MFRTGFSKSIVYLLAFLLGIVFFGQILASLINAEAFVFGTKLSGAQAVVYLFGNSIIGIVLAYVILRRARLGTVLSLVYFLYNVLAVAITNLQLFGKFILPPIFVIGFAVSAIVLLLQSVELKPNDS